MAVDLKVSVRRGISQLRRSIARLTSQLASLRGELRRHERVYGLLSGVRGRRRSRRGRERRKTTVDWSAVLRSLPGTFTIDHLTRRTAVKRKPRAYLRQVVVRWAKEGKIKRTGRGRYQKV